MPSPSGRYDSQVFGGVPVNDIAGGRAVHPDAGNYVLAGGPDWADAPRTCSETRLDTGWPCEATPLKNEDVCVAHKRSRERNNKKKD